MNSTSLSSADEPDYEHCSYVTLVTGWLSICLFILCVTGNSTSLITWIRVGRNSSFSASILMFITLSITDSFLMVVLFVSNSITAIIYYYQGNESFFLTSVYPYLLMYVWPLGSMALFTSIWITTIMSVQRFCALRYPLGEVTRRLTSWKSTLVQIVCTSIAGIVYNLPMFFEYQLNKSLNQTTSSLSVSSLMVNPIYQIVYSTTGYFLFMNALPLIITMTMTIMIVKLLLESEKMRATMSTTQRKDRGITISLVSIVIIFIICQLPNTVNRVMQMISGLGFSPCGSPEFYIQEVATTMIAFNSSVNVFIFASCSSVFKSVLLGGFCKQGSNASNSSTSGSTSLTSLSTLKSAASTDIS